MMKIDIPNPCKHWCSHYLNDCSPEDLMSVKMIEKCKSYTPGVLPTPSQKDFLEQQFKLTVNNDENDNNNSPGNNNP